MAFIQEFKERRFASKQVPEQKKSSSKPKPKPKQTATSSSSASITNTETEGVFPALPSNQQSYETMWPANISVNQKKEDEYFAG